MKSEKGVFPDNLVLDQTRGSTQPMNNSDVKYYVLLLNKRTKHNLNTIILHAKYTSTASSPMKTHSVLEFRVKNAEKNSCK